MYTFIYLYEIKYMLNHDLFLNSVMSHSPAVRWRTSGGHRLWFRSCPVAVFITWDEKVLTPQLFFNSSMSAAETHSSIAFGILLIQARLCCNNTPSLPRAVHLSYLDNHVTSMRAESSTLRILLMGPSGQKSCVYVMYYDRHHDWKNGQCHGEVFLSLGRPANIN